MHVQILYCRPCGYAPRARELARDLRERFGADVDIEEGRFGQFDVLLDGELVASKGRTFWRRVSTHGAPASEKVFAAIEKHLRVRDGDACETDRTRPALFALGGLTE